VLKATSSALRYSWAMSLFGTQQLTNLLTASGQSEPTRQAQASSYFVTQAIEEQFSDLIFAGFQIGDEMQRRLVDLTFDSLTPGTLNSDYVSKVTAEFLEQSREALAVFTSTENAQIAWQQLKNNYEVFNLVKNASGSLHVPAGGKEFDLARLVAAAYAAGAYRDLWLIEGLGHDYAMSFFPRWGKNEPVRGILTEGPARELPDKSLTMMHAGLGLAFAQQLMNRITPYSPASDVRQVLAEFIKLVKNNSRKGYAGAAYESLGLVTRFWHSQLMTVVDQELHKLDPELPGYFWHGAGRAHYFLPIFFVPGLLSPWSAVERESPHELALQNMIAGLAWATAIVNVRQPKIMENFLKTQGARVASNPAFSNGVMSTLIMGLDITPGDVFIERFLQYRPDGSDSTVRQLWEELIARPAHEAVYSVYPILKKHRRLGEVFRYQNLRGLADRLQKGAGASVI
jgi:hypothetical protein